MTAAVTADQVGQQATVTITGRIARVVAGQVAFLDVDGHQFIFAIGQAAHNGVTWQLHDNDTEGES